MVSRSNGNGNHQRSPEEMIERYRVITQHDAALYDLAEKARVGLEFTAHQGDELSILPGLGRVACAAYRSPLLCQEIDPEASPKGLRHLDVMQRAYRGTIEYRNYEGAVRLPCQQSNRLSIFGQLEGHFHHREKGNFVTALMIEVGTTGDYEIAFAQSDYNGQLLKRRSLSSVHERQATRTRLLLRLNDLVLRAAT